jgi:hypothetical protein
VNGQDGVAFHDNADGRLGFSIDYPFFVFEKARLTDNKHFNFAVILPSVAFILLAVLFWPIGAAIRWHYGKSLELDSSEKRLRLMVRLVCIVDLIFLAAWAVFISGVDNVETLSRSRDPFLYLTELLGVLGAIGTLLVLFHAFRSWSTAGRWIWSKLFDVALAFACVGFTWFIWHWNLINFNLHY